MKLLKLILALILNFLSRPSEESLDVLEEQVEKKRQAMSNALNAGFDEHFHVLREQWLRLCKKRNRLRKRL